MKRLGLFVATALVLIAVALPSAAQNEVAAVTVVAAHDSKVVATYPAAGDAVAPGLLIVKVAFDIAMAPDRWRFARSGTADYPQCLDTPRLLADGRTFVLLCQVAPGGAYAIELNAGTARGFTGLGGRRAPDYTLRFTTTQAPPTPSLALAMTAAGLADGDSPLMGAGPTVRAAAAEPATTLPR